MLIPSLVVIIVIIVISRLTQKAQLIVPPAQPTAAPTLTACTEEAKLCANGDYVSRNSSINCQFNPCTNLLPQPQTTPQVLELSGTLRYSKGAVYDGVDYSLSLEFDEQLVDKTHASGEDMPVISLPIVPSTKALRKELMEKVDQPVILTGAITWGLAESKQISASGFRQI